MADKSRVHIIISGRVQGVFFRDFTRQKADNLGLTGWIKNIPDSRVEIIAEGEKDKLIQLIESVKVGPEHAKVQNCEIEWSDYSGKYRVFEITF